MKALLLILSLTVFSSHGYTAEGNFFDELDPRSPDIEKKLRDLDLEYERETGISPFLPGNPLDEIIETGCIRDTCKVWADIDKATQRLYLYIDGYLTYTFKTSTGRSGFDTPDFDRHPNGRIYEKWTSTKYPEGDYNGLGNMPYAVFIAGGFAIHGTTRGSWGRLGTPASHGCIRLHPDNGQIFNVLVRRNGIINVWITVR